MTNYIGPRYEFGDPQNEAISTTKDDPFKANPELAAVYNDVSLQTALNNPSGSSWLTLDLWNIGVLFVGSENTNAEIHVAYIRQNNGMTYSVAIMHHNRLVMESNFDSREELVSFIVNSNICKP